MKTKLIVRAGTAAAAVVLVVLAIAATKEPLRSATQAFMRQKLICSQEIIEGLALEKFDLVAKNALRLRNMTQSNVWFTMKQPDHMLHTTNYQRSVEALYTAAVDKDLDAATEAYASVAKSCIECHRVILPTAATKQPLRPATQAFMRQKLVRSQGIIEGLALEKFDLVSKNALGLRNMTQTNLWFTMKQPDYMRHTTNYQRNVEALYTAAVDKNLDAATEAYAKVAKSCVECHRIVRLEQHKQLLLPRK